MKYTIVKKEIIAGNKPKDDLNGFNGIRGCGGQ